MSLRGTTVTRTDVRICSDRFWTIFGIGIFGVGLVLRIGLMLLARRAGQVEHTEVTNIARSIVSCGLFGNPYETASTGATAHLAPIYPYVVAILLRLLGSGSSFDWAVHVLTAAVASAQFAILPAIAGAWFGDRRIGVTPALLGAILPFRLWLETSGGHDAVYVGLALALLFWGAARLASPGLPSMWFFAWYGVSWGVATLVSPVVLPVLGALAAVWLYWNRSPRALQSAVLLLACCAAIVLPWTVRNYVAVGTLSPVRDNFGLELAVSNNEAARPLMTENYFSRFRHPFFDRREAAIMRSMGEAAYYRMRGSEGTQWIERNKSRFALLTVQRIFWFWFTPTNALAKTIFFSGLVVMAAIGLSFLGRRKPRAASLLAVLWIVYPLPLYILQVDPRYRYPIDWLLWLLAGYALVYGAERGFPELWKRTGNEVASNHLAL